MKSVCSVFVEDVEVGEETAQFVTFLGEAEGKFDDIPTWEFEVERPIYVIDQRNQRGPSAWVDEVVEWTAQGVFALVVPETAQQRG